MPEPYLSPPTSRTAIDHATEEMHEQCGALARFWTARAIDRANGGYVTSFDDHGVALDESEKYLLSHTRLVWSFTSLAVALGDAKLMGLARHGVQYLKQHFWDAEHGGWYWKLDREGGVLDPAKLVYGQGFAIYALAAYGAADHDDDALRLACETFDLLHVHAVDATYGGYSENLDGDWTPFAAPPGEPERKSLDIHMHLLEAFTELALATADATHLRRLSEVRELILTRMIDPSSGVGGNQYDRQFRPLDPVVIDRTWIAERTTPEQRGPFAPSTSYGHNLELGWLLMRADTVLGRTPRSDVDLVRALANHALTWGFDASSGGVYREGPPIGPATDTDKEFWPNAEALVGFLEAHIVTGDARYLDAFLRTWHFARTCLIHPSGEWRIRTDANGRVIDGALGNHWTGGYHTVRAMLESARRLEALHARGRASQLPTTHPDLSGSIS